MIYSVVSLLIPSRRYIRLAKEKKSDFKLIEDR